MSGQSTLLEIEKLTVRIPLRSGDIVHAATDIELSVGRGEVVAVIGESGCGKSIIASSVVGSLPPQAITSGHVHYHYPDGRFVDILSRRSKTAALAPTDEELAGRRIALVPQSAATFLTPVRTVGYQLAEAIAVLGSGHRAEELLARVQLHDEVAAMYPHELSGGMAQRVAVAFALAGDPDLVIADEPTAALDPELTMSLLRMLRDIADAGAGVMLITHDISELRDSAIADRIAVMYASRFEETGPAQQVLEAPSSQYMRDLLAALPENGMRPMPGAVPSLTNLDEDYCYARRLEEARK
ncbi:MAG: ABC transporter ATP-binding protein [Corynebacterium sp.]|uniref:ATP-binding cassette domain-containing protein n=1 Tax=Corynebacterium sp. TaxID=1720 RepID=UPI0026DBF664|nr:ABC transporter ATP-binding protein [Corynebacterium sp.]MDO5030864.1 ABC transporter ATP-binding protein [Corynebacterium sp.]